MPRLKPKRQDPQKVWDFEAESRRRRHEEIAEAQYEAERRRYAERLAICYPNEEGHWYNGRIDNLDAILRERNCELIDPCQQPCMGCVGGPMNNRVVSNDMYRGARSRGSTFEVVLAEQPDYNVFRMTNAPLEPVPIRTTRHRYVVDLWIPNDTPPVWAAVYEPQDAGPNWFYEMRRQREREAEQREREAERRERRHNEFDSFRYNSYLDRIFNTPVRATFNA